MQSIILSYNSILKKEIVKNVETYFDRAKGIENTIELFNINTFDLLLQNMVTPTVRLEAIDSIGIALEMLGENNSNVKTNYNTEINSTIRNSANKIVLANRTTDKEIRYDIMKILQNNPNANKNQLSNLITENIDSNFLNRYANRSKTIATTTSTLTIGHSQNLIQKKFNAKKRWLSMRDKRVRDQHEKADGQYADELGYFNVGGEELPYPGGGTKGGNNINCRCRLRLEKSEAIQKPKEPTKPTYNNLGKMNEKELLKYFNNVDDGFLNDAAKFRNFESILNKERQNYYDNLDTQTRFDLYDYIDESYADINKALRNNDYKDYNYKKGKNILDNDANYEFKSNELKTLFRGESYYEDDNIIFDRLKEKLLNNNNYETNALFSTSYKKDISLDFSNITSDNNSIIYKINNKKDFKAGFGTENENEIIIRTKENLAIKSITEIDFNGYSKLIVEMEY